MIPNTRHTIGSRMSAFTEPHQRLGERGVRVHGHVTCNIVENIRLRQIIQAIERADRDRGWEPAVPQTIEKYKGRYVTANRLRLKTRQRA